MSHRYLSILLLVSAAFSAGAQDLKNILTEIQTIDSLLAYNKLEKAERKADSLYALIEDSDSPQLALKVRLQKAIILQEKNENQKALAILLDVVSESEKEKYYDITCESAIYISLIHEINGDFVHAYEYIKTAEDLCIRYGIDQLYSTVLVRMASIHRILASNKPNDRPQINTLEKLGFKASFDSTMSFAQQAIPYAQKYGIGKDEIDSYFLIGSCLSRQNKGEEARTYFLKEIPFYSEVEDYVGIFFTYMNVSDQSYDLKEFQTSLAYNDTCLMYYDRVTYADKYLVFQKRAEIFEALNMPDSANINLKIAINEMVRLQVKDSNTEIRKLEEQYQNDKKEQTIQNRNRQLLLALSLLGVILIASVVFVRKNQEINRQNKIINRQVIELQKTVEQKEILLSELQHRVKNNLQYVISLLEIQKESIGHSSIEDLIRNNQNRIHSIALLHKKLNVDESVDDVELTRYVEELTELVKESYGTMEKNVDISIRCDIATLPIQKAMPVGLIIVELVSNSIKHAFSNRPKGKINIEITRDPTGQVYKLHYLDNGTGFDFEKVNTQGLGIEITKGLIDQLDADIETSTTKGFEITISFK